YESAESFSNAAFHGIFFDELEPRSARGGANSGSNGGSAVSFCQTTRDARLASRTSVRGARYERNSVSRRSKANTDAASRREASAKNAPTERVVPTDL